MDLFALLEGVTHMFNVFLHRAAHTSVLLVEVCLNDLILIGLLEHIDPMQAFDPLLELLVVVQVVIEHLINLVLELLLVLLLLADLRDSLRFLLLHTFALQLHVLDDETQVLIDYEKVLRLVVHLGFLLLQSLDDLHPRPNA